MTTGLLIFRENVRNFYRQHQRVIQPIVRFLLGFLFFWSLSKMFPYSAQFGKMTVVIAFAFVCTWLPIGAIFFLGMLYTCVQLSAFRIEIAGIYLVLFLFIYLIYIRIENRSCIPILAVPIVILLKIPYVLPILIGMYVGPIGIIPMGFGFFLYYFSLHVKDTVAIFSTAGEGDMKVYQYLMEQVFSDKEMVLLIIGYSLVVCIVWVWYRMSHNNSWNQAIIIGGIAGMLLFLVGGFILDVELNILGIVIGFAGAVIVGLIVQFFKCVVDETRIEYVQFEDDEYYYYVKAVPKVSVAQKEISVKRINTRKYTKDQEE